MIATSPNATSRSMRQTRLEPPLASATARFVAIVVLPHPPFGANTEITFASTLPLD